MQFISEHKTGYDVPGAIAFDEYQGKYKKEKKDKKDDKKKVCFINFYIAPITVILFVLFLYSVSSTVLHHTNKSYVPKISALT